MPAAGSGTAGIIPYECPAKVAGMGGGKVGSGTLALLFKQACVNLFKSDQRASRRRRAQPQNGDDRGRRTKDWACGMEYEGRGKRDTRRSTVGVSITYKSLLD